MVTTLDSKAVYGVTDTYIERVGNDITFKDANNASPVTLSSLVTPRRTETINLAVSKVAACFRCPGPLLVSVAGNTNTNTIVPAYSFDPSTENFICYSVQLPADLDTTGSVNVRFQWLPSTAAANNVVWKMYHAKVAANSTIDVAFSTKTVTSAGSATNNILSEAVITDTVSNLTWTAGAHLVLHFSRDAANGSDTLTTNAYLFNIILELPLKNTGSTASVNAAANALVLNPVMFNNATNPNFQMDFTADAVVMGEGSSGQNKRYKTFYSVSQTFDITTNLDTGAEASNTWYYCWLVSTDGSTITKKVSTSATLPTGLNTTDFRIRVGSIYNDGSSNFRRIRKVDNKVEYQGDYPNIASATSVTAWTSISVSTFVPPVSSRAWGVASADFTASGHHIEVTGDNTASTAVTSAAPMIFLQIGATTTIRHGFLWDFNLKTAQTVYWGVSSTNSSKVFIGGYYEELYS